MPKKKQVAVLEADASWTDKYIIDVDGILVSCKCCGQSIKFDTEQDAKDYALDRLGVRL